MMLPSDCRHARGTSVVVKVPCYRDGPRIYTERRHLLQPSHLWPDSSNTTYRECPFTRAGSKTQNGAWTPQWMFSESKPSHTSDLTLVSLGEGYNFVREFVNKVYTNC